VRNKEICIRMDEEIKQGFKKFISENKLSTYAEGLKYYQMIAGSEVFVTIQECRHFGEYPPDSKHFVTCDESGKRVPKKRGCCEGCKHNRETKVLMDSRRKIEQANSELQRKFSETQRKLGNLSADIVSKRREMEKIDDLLSMPEQLKKKDDELREEKDKTNYLDDVCKELQGQLETLQRPEGNAKVEEISQKLNVAMNRPVESKPVFHGNLSQTENPPIQKVERNAPLVERTTTIKEKFAPPPQQKLPLPTQQKAALPPEHVECPDINESVNVEETCKRKCDNDKRDNCLPYIELVLKKAKAIPNQ